MTDTPILSVTDLQKSFGAVTAAKTSTSKSPQAKWSA